MKSRLHDGVKYEWTDITTEFVSACSGLELGELVHDSKYVSSDQQLVLIQFIQTTAHI